MRLAFSTLFSSTLALLLASTAVIAAPQTYLTVYGEPAKYGTGFSHFDYANPNAPKGGSLRRSAIEIGRFDHVLPYIDKGIGVSQIDGWLYSPLALRSLDEPYTVYGLVAEKMERADDGLSLRFYLNPKARFADGTPITAEDVRYSFDLLMTQGSLRFRTLFADVKHVEVEGERQVRFDFPAMKTAPWRWISPPCRCSPSTGGKPATSPTAAATKRRWAAARTKSARSTRAAPSPLPATLIGGARTCRSAAVCTTSIT